MTSFWSQVAWTELAEGGKGGVREGKGGEAKRGEGRDIVTVQISIH